MKTSLAIVLSLVAVGVIAANQIGAQTTVAPTAPTTTNAGVPASATIPTVQNIVEITRTVPAGASAVDVFTVPAGVTLVVTDLLVTNTGTAAACGGAVNRGGAAVATTPAASTTGTGTPSTTSTAPTLSPSPTVTTPTTTSTTPTTTSPPATGTPTTAATAPLAGTPATATPGTLTQTDSTVTGPLCVPAQTTTTVPLTTGIEFSGGQVVQLLNAPVSAAPTTAGAPGSLAFHLRGMLITLL